MIDLLIMIAIGIVFFTVALVALVVALSSFGNTSMGHAMLPDWVTDVVDRVTSGSRVTGVVVRGENLMQVQVVGMPYSQSVSVFRIAEIEFAVTFDPEVRIPSKGTYALAIFRHNLLDNSPISPAAVEQRVRQSLKNTMGSKRFDEVEAADADLFFHVYFALEDSVSPTTISNSFRYKNVSLWTRAIEAVVNEQSKVDDDDTLYFAKGTLLMDVIERTTKKLLWRAVATADIAVNVPLEKSDRNQRAIAGMLRQFPPKPIVSN